MFKIVSKYNSNIKRMLNDVIYYKNYLHTFYFDESIALILNNLRCSNFYLE